MRHLLEAATFRRRERALAHLATLSRQLPEELHERVAAKLRSSADPDSAVLQLSKLATEKQSELVRINRLYDAELERLRRLWAGAPAGSLGPLDAGSPASR